MEQLEATKHACENGANLIYVGAGRFHLQYLVSRGRGPVAFRRQSLLDPLTLKQTSRLTGTRAKRLVHVKVKLSYSRLYAASMLCFTAASESANDIARRLLDSIKTHVCRCIQGAPQMHTQKSVTKIPRWGESCNVGHKSKAVRKATVCPSLPAKATSTTKPRPNKHVPIPAQARPRLFQSKPKTRPLCPVPGRCSRLAPRQSQFCRLFLLPCPRPQRMGTTYLTPVIAGRHRVDL